MIFEFCIDSVDGAIAATKYDVKRVELCAALSVGGLTPSFGLIKQCAVQKVEVHVMIRHVEGGFFYSKEDIVIMEQDIKMAKDAGATGVVFGCLKPNNELDLIANERLFKIAKQNELEVTFHRAFDSCIDPISAIEQLIDLGFDRLLTSGQKSTAIEGIDLINILNQKANGKIEIMAGSGVNSANAFQLSETGIDALHFTIHQKQNEINDFGMGSKTEIDEEKIESILNMFSA